MLCINFLQKKKIIEKHVEMAHIYKMQEAFDILWFSCILYYNITIYTYNYGNFPIHLVIIESMLFVWSRFHILIYSNPEKFFLIFIFTKD